VPEPTAPIQAPVTTDFTVVPKYLAKKSYEYSYFDALNGEMNSITVLL